jgi:hypothetical protein
VSFWSTSFLGENEAGTNPDTAGTKHKSGSKTLTVEDTTSSNNLNWLAGQWASLTLAKLDNGWDQDGSWDITGVTTSFTTLSTDDINTEVETLLDVLWVSNHVHVNDTGVVKTVDNMLRWHTNSGNEKLSTAFDDDGDELIQFALGIIVAVITDR